MTLLYYSTENDGFSITRGVRGSVSTNTGFYHSGYSRCAASINTTQECYFISPTHYNEVWVRAILYDDELTSANLIDVLTIGIWHIPNYTGPSDFKGASYVGTDYTAPTPNSNYYGAVFMAAIRQEGSDEDVTTVMYNNAGTQTEFGNANDTADDTKIYDLQVVGGADGKVVAYQNGTPYAYQAVNWDSLFGSPSILPNAMSFISERGENDVHMYQHGLIMTGNESTIGMHVASLGTDSGLVGDANEWHSQTRDESGDAASAVNNPTNFADNNIANGQDPQQNRIYTNAADDYQLFSTAVRTGNTGRNIRAIGVNSQTRKTHLSSGPQNFRHILQLNGSPADRYESAQQSPQLEFQGYHTSWETNPATASAWQNSDLDLLQFGIKSET